jgi:hypothetical protein
VASVPLVSTIRPATTIPPGSTPNYASTIIPATHSASIEHLTLPVQSTVLPRATGLLQSVAPAQSTLNPESTILPASSHAPEATAFYASTIIPPSSRRLGEGETPDPPFIHPGTNVMAATVVPRTSDLPASSKAPIATNVPEETNVPESTRFPDPSVPDPTNTPDQAVKNDDEESSSVVLLVVSIVLMVVLFALFGYLIMKEKQGEGEEGTKVDELARDDSKTLQPGGIAE